MENYEWLLDLNLINWIDANAIYENGKDCLRNSLGNKI